MISLYKLILAIFSLNIYNNTKTQKKESSESFFAYKELKYKIPLTNSLVNPT